MPPSNPDQRLTPEEESIGDPEDEGDIDDTLPADLWLDVSPSHPRSRLQQNQVGLPPG